VREWQKIVGENLPRVRERVAHAAERCGRRAEEITVVAVTKTFPPEAIRAAHMLGLRHFGENRVQEWAGKRAQVADLGATWHLVGHLQSNKARKAVELFDAIDSVDSTVLAERLELICAKRCGGPQAGLRKLPILLEVRLAPEETKSGVEPEKVPGLAEKILSLPHLALRGLMCIPPFFDDPQGARPYFRRLRELRDALQRQFASVFQPPPSNFQLLLSMGMSHDFEVAIEEGATEIRLGTALFGERSR
jgi:pyridoxal phosphate enzyme (YggS family)